MRRRNIRIKYLLLRNGAYRGRLLARADSPPSIRMNASGAIKTSFSGSFAPMARSATGARVEIDWLTDEIQPVLCINGAEYPLGVFMPATPREIFDGVSDYVTVEAYDRGWRVRDTNSSELLYWAAGTLYLDAVEQLLMAAGINTVLKTPSNAVFAEDREDWDVGTSYLDVINQLLEEIGYNQLWFDTGGAAVLEPASVPSAAAIEHVLNASDPDTLVRPGLRRETDYYQAPNVFIVACANPDKSGPMVATAVNDNPASPLSVPRRGRQICAVSRLNNVPDQAALQAYANKLRDESLITGETLEVSTGLLPGWGVGDVVGLYYEDVLGVCVEREYTMELAVGGTMRHVMERVVYALD